MEGGGGGADFGGGSFARYGGGLLLGGGGLGRSCGGGLFGGGGFVAVARGGGGVEGLCAGGGGFGRPCGGGLFGGGGFDAAFSIGGGCNFAGGGDPAPATSIADVADAANRNIALHSLMSAASPFSPCTHGQLAQSRQNAHRLICPPEQMLSCSGVTAQVLPCARISCRHAGPASAVTRD